MARRLRRRSSTSGRVLPQSAWKNGVDTIKVEVDGACLSRFLLRTESSQGFPHSSLEMVCLVTASVGSWLARPAVLECSLSAYAFRRLRFYNLAPLASPRLPRA